MRVVWVKRQGEDARRFPLLPSGHLMLDEMAERWNLNPRSLEAGDFVLLRDSSGRSKQTLDEIASELPPENNGLSKETPLLITGSGALGLITGFDDPTLRIVSRYATPAVPDLASLKEFLLTKPEGLCFLLSPPRYEGLKSEDLHGMFCTGTSDSYCLKLDKLTSLIVDPPQAGATEFSLIPLWNSLIHEGIKAYMAPSVPFTFDRNSNFETQTLSQLPDYVGYVLLYYSLFRGEEMSDRGLGDPKRDLVEKLVWVYKTLPYLLGYHARGTLVTFGALHRDNAAGGAVQCEDLVTLNLSEMSDRLRCQLLVFNLGRVLAGLGDLCSTSHEISDTCKVQEAGPNNGGKSVLLSGYSVIKGYMDLDKAARVWDMYSRIKSCPNAEACHTNSSPRSRKRKRNENGRMYTLTFTPRLDLNQRASSVPELLRALLHVSNALCFAHGCGVMHRDVSWRNVGLDHGSNEWILFDWDDSSISPTTSAAPELCSECHAPEICRGSHSTAVDVWGLGWLIHSSKLTLTPELQKLEHDCLQENPKARPTITSCRKRLQVMARSS